MPDDEREYETTTDKKPPVREPAIEWEKKDQDREGIETR